MGTYPDATAVFNIDSIGLCSLMNMLNHGYDLGGNAGRRQPRSSASVWASIPTR